jgi:hypothetical protein
MGNVTSKEKMAKKVRIGVIPFRTVHQSSWRGFSRTYQSV